MTRPEINRATLYLIPAPLDENTIRVLPGYLLDAVKTCQVFFVENERSARRYLKTLWKEMVIDDYEWFTIHKAEEEVRSVFRQKLKEGKTIGLISEAGCPGIADPGQLLTETAHRAGAMVRPIVGPEFHPAGADGQRSQRTTIPVLRLSPGGQRRSRKIAPGTGGRIIGAALHANFYRDPLPE